MPDSLHNKAYCPVCGEEGLVVSCDARMGGITGSWCWRFVISVAHSDGKVCDRQFWAE